MARLPQSNFRFFEKKKQTLKQKSAVKFPEFIRVDRSRYLYDGEHL